MKKISFLLVAALMLSCASADENKDAVYNTDGIAIGGYDPVAYFEQGEAKKGVEVESIKYQGLTYYFSSTKNKLLFQENPEKYLPQYGGWCAYAVASSSSKMEPDPTLWQIQDGELQLFYDDWMTSITGNLKKEWNSDPKSYKSQADENWVNMQ